MVRILYIMVLWLYRETLVSIEMPKERIVRHLRVVVLSLVKIKCKNKLKKGQHLRELIEWINHIQIQGSHTFILEKMTEH